MAYRLGDHVYRAAAVDPPVIEDVSARFDHIEAGQDSTLGLSRDGHWAGLTTSRLGCGDYDCLAILPVDQNGANVAAAMVVHANGQVLHPVERTVIGRDAAFIVYAAGGGPHTRDLWLVRGGAGSYGAPTLLTAQSSFDFNLQPSLTPDERALVFDCSATGGPDAISLCRVDVDGGNFRRLLAPTDGPSALGDDEVHSGSEAPDGRLVFESSWKGERIWRRDPGGALSPIGDYNDDNTPCVLPDGRIASLWLNAPDNFSGAHQLKVMSGDGATYQLLDPRDVTDVGLSCSQ